MNKSLRGKRIFIAGHRGLVGGALVRKLTDAGCDALILRSRAELDLTDQALVRDFFRVERPEYVLLAAARVGGIKANDSFPAEFIRQNLMIQTNIIHSACEVGVERLLFFGSSCIYPKFASQPIREEALLTGPLELTNEAYAVAKIAGIKMCEAYNRQYGTSCLALMPSNLYGPGDNFDLESSHVLPALLRKFHEALERNADAVTVWGSGEPRREFLYVDDLAGGCLHLLNLSDGRFAELVGQYRPPLLNLGVGRDQTIREAAETIRKVVGFKGELVFDRSKPDGTPRKLLDISRMKDLGWQAETSLESGIESVWRWFRERSDKDR